MVDTETRARRRSPARYAARSTWTARHPGRGLLLRLGASRSDDENHDRKPDMVFSSISPTVHTVTERKLDRIIVYHILRATVDYTMYSTLQYETKYRREKFGELQSFTVM